MFQFLQIILPAITFSMWGFVFVYLQNAGHILSWLPDWLDGTLRKNMMTDVVKKWLTCSICHTGIVSIIYCLATMTEIRHVFAFMTISLFFSIIISEVYERNY